MTIVRALLSLTIAVGLVACATSHPSPAVPASSSPYLYRLLDVRKLGAKELARIEKENTVVAAYVAKAGKPDFLIEPSTTDIELIYYLPSRLEHFHLGADGKWTSSELHPLPMPLLGVLPPEMRAGTPVATGSEETGCWNTTIPDGSCRTCCTPSDVQIQVCSISCQ
jgi:hypothetical protein